MGSEAAPASTTRRTDLRLWLERYRDSLRWNLPYWPMMVVNIGLWLRLPTQRFFVPDDVPDTKVLADAWSDIRVELDAVLANGLDGIPGFQEVDPGQRRLTDDNTWRTFVLRYAGQDCEPNRVRCPRTASLLDQVGGLYTAMFSVLEPGARIPLHAGAIKGLVRLHLPLLVPTRGDCWIEIGGERFTWIEGEPLIWDDTYLHRVHNDTGQVRVVLFVDLERPMPTERLTRFNRWVLGRMSASKRIQVAIERAEQRST